MVPVQADAALHQLIFAPCRDNAVPRPLCPPTKPPPPEPLRRKEQREVAKTQCRKDKMIF